MQPSSLADIEATVARALQEDVGAGDLTAALVPASARMRATVITREPAVVCGSAWFDEVFRQLERSIVIQWSVQDGQQVAADTLLCTLEGPARSLLTGERTALNLLQTLSGTATTTSRYVEAVSGTGCRILDTRKTLPGLRLAQKYAVRCGGGTNHRIGLFDALLVKENHIAAAGSITAAVAAARQASAQVMLEVEVESLDELREALECGVDRVLLDEFTPDQMRAAVSLARARKGKQCELEASGSITLENIRQIAATGVDFISVGSLTKHLRAVDLSMRMGG